MAEDTFLLTLPDGTKARCWKREALAIKADIAATGSVVLVRDPGADVYDRVAPDSVDADLIRRHGRHV